MTASPAVPEESARISALNPSAKPDVALAIESERPSSRAQFLLRALALVLLFSGAAVYESVHLSSLNSADVWVHLRTGTWIFENHALPLVGLFSQYPNSGWNDSSWLFDFLLGVAYRIFGLHALPLLLMALKVALAAITFLLARTLGAGFWQALVLSAVAQYVIPGLQPLPYVFSILFFALAFKLLLSSRQSGSVPRLYWLPLLFLLWANLQVQFVLGLILVAVFGIAVLTEQWLRMQSVSWLSPRLLPLPIKPVSAIAGLCLVASCATPYGYHPFTIFFESLYSGVAFQHFAEMSAMTFRRPQDYALMLLVMMAFLALGRRRSLDVFQLLILLFGTAVAFRIQRDGWLAVLVAVGVVATASPTEDVDDERPPALGFASGWIGIAAVTAVVVIFAAVRLPNRHALMNRVARNFPVAACDFIASNRMSQPLFNDYPFGSFVTWYLPQYPVVVDSRVELYGDKVLSEYFDIVGGKERLDEHPMIARAGTLLLQRNSAIDKALRNLPALRAQYRLVYSDDLADVFTPVNTEENR